MSVGSGNAAPRRAFTRLSGTSQLNIDLPVSPGRIVPIALLGRGVKVINGAAGEPWPDGLPDKGTINVRYEAGAAGGAPRISISFDGTQIIEIRSDLQRWTQAPEAHREFPGEPLTSIFVLRDTFDITAWTLRVFDGEARVLARSVSPSGGGKP